MPNQQSLILVVDDDEDNAQLLETALELAGFAVKVARSLGGARTVLAETQVDAIVTDYSLGDGDAYDLLRSLDGARPKVVVLVTGYGGREDRERSQTAGFDAHFVKPIAIAELEKTLRERLE